MILTNTYQCSVEGYVDYLDLDVEQSIELIKKTVRLAHIAKDKYLAECCEAKLHVPDGMLTEFTYNISLILHMKQTTRVLIL